MILLNTLMVLNIHKYSHNKLKYIIIQTYIYSHAYKLNTYYVIKCIIECKLDYYI